MTASARRSLGMLLALGLLGLRCTQPAPDGRSELAAAATPSHAAGPGPAIGEALPAFEALDQSGRLRTLASLRGPKGLVVNINRSVVW